MNENGYQKIFKFCAVKTDIERSERHPRPQWRTIFLGSARAALD
jgi:hypothetical protein